MNLRGRFLWVLIGLSVALSNGKQLYAQVSVTSFSSLYTITASREIFRSNDNADTWSKTGKIQANAFAFAFSQFTLWAYSIDGGVGIITRSGNMGATWLNVPVTGLPLEKNIYELAKNGFMKAMNTTLYTGVGRNMYRSFDDGSTWLKTDFDADDAIQSICVHGSEIFTATKQTLYYSQDSGKTWSKIKTDVSSFGILDFAIKGSAWFVAANTGGVYRSLDSGTTWKQVGLSNVRVEGLVANDSLVFARTMYGGGIFRSENNGLTWQQVTKGLSQVFITGLALSKKTSPRKDSSEKYPEPYEFTMVEKEPYIDIKVLQSKVIYPEEAKKAGIQGQVIVRALIDTEGICRATIIESSDSVLLNESASNAVKSCIFTPAIKDGKPTKCWVSIPMVYRLR